MVKEVEISDDTSSETSSEEKSLGKDQSRSQIESQFKEALQTKTQEHERELNLLRSELRKHAENKEKSLREHINQLEAKIRILEAPSKMLIVEQSPPMPNASIDMAAKLYETQTMGISSESHQQSSSSVSQPKQQPAQKPMKGPMNLSSLDKIVGMPMIGQTLIIPSDVHDVKKAQMDSIQKMPIEVSISGNGSSSATLFTQQVQQIITNYKQENLVSSTTPNPVIRGPSPRNSAIPAAANPVSSYRPMMGGGLSRNASVHSFHQGQYVDSGRNSYVSGQARSVAGEPFRDQFKVASNMSPYYEPVSGLRQETEHTVYQPQNTEPTFHERLTVGQQPFGQLDHSKTRRLVSPSTPADLIRNNLDQMSERALSVAGSVDRSLAPSTFTYRSTNMPYIGSLTSGTPYTPGAVFSDLKQHLKNFGTTKPKQEPVEQSNQKSVFQVVQEAAKHTPLQAPIASAVNNYFNRERQPLTLIKPQDRSLLQKGSNLAGAQFNKTSVKPLVPSHPIAFRSSQTPTQVSTSQARGTNQGLGITITSNTSARQHPTSPTEFYTSQYSVGHPSQTLPNSNQRGHLCLTSSSPQQYQSYSAYLSSNQSYLLKK